jgi:uncharacterized membrane protein YvlD (DUF360 family)
MRAPANIWGIITLGSFILFVAVIVVLIQNLANRFGFHHSFWTVFIAAWFGALVGEFISTQIAIPYLRRFYQEFIDKELGRHTA